METDRPAPQPRPAAQPKPDPWPQPDSGSEARAGAGAAGRADRRVGNAWSHGAAADCGSPEGAATIA